MGLCRLIGYERRDETLGFDGGLTSIQWLGLDVSLRRAPSGCRLVLDAEPGDFDQSREHCALFVEIIHLRRLSRSSMVRPSLMIESSHKDVPLFLDVGEICILVIANELELKHHAELLDVGLNVMAEHGRSHSCVRYRASTHARHNSTLLSVNQLWKPESNKAFHSHQNNNAIRSTGRGN